MNHDVMTGMLWAALFMVGVPLAIGVGVLITVLRRRRGDHHPAQPGP